MPDLGKNFFQGERDLTLQEAKNLEAISDGDLIDNVLEKFGWQSNQLTAGVTTHLSPDNRRVSKSSFFLRGTLLADPITIQARKCWSDAGEDVVIKFWIPVGSRFVFNSGGAFSDYIDSQTVDHSFLEVGEDGEDDIPIDQAELQEKGVGQFCLRAIAYATKAKPRGHLVAKVTVLLFPKSASDLDDLCDAAQSPSWPGIKVWEAECPFTPTTALGTWGCPIFPIIIPGQAFADLQNVASGQALRHAISSVLQHTASPEAHVKASTLSTHWGKIIKDPTSLVMRPPPTTWPTTTRPEAEPGKWFNKILIPSFTSFLKESIQGNCVRSRHRPCSSGGKPNVFFLLLKSDSDSDPMFRSGSGSRSMKNTKMKKK